MSAREELFSYLTPAFGPAEFSNEMLDAYRDEVLHEAGARLRAEVDEWDGWPEKQDHWHAAATFIEPEETTND